VYGKLNWVSANDSKYGEQTRVALRYWLLVVLSAWSLSAAPITVFGTGLDSNGQVLIDGAVDPHYQLILSDSPLYPGPDAVVADTQISPVDNWISTGMTSKWISIRADAATHNPEGAYIYRTTFDLTGFDLATVMLTGRFAPDDVGAIFLNNVASHKDVCCYYRWAPFTISSGFVTGVNTLDFLVENSGGGPTGIRVDLAGTGNVSAVPEPGTWMLLVIGGGAFGLLASTSRRKGFGGPGMVRSTKTR
jgi:PEP-CTERM motif